MARPKRRHPANVDGDLYVDTSCIDCDTCRWMAPEVFDRRDGQSRVHEQPVAPEARRRALTALVSCPTASIGTVGDAYRDELQAVLDSFPLPITERVYHCGYHSESSFGAASYFLERPAGNVLIDSPRWSSRLADQLAERGGVAMLFLTHADDVANHERWARRFGCERVLHAGDAGGSLAGLERLIEGTDPVALADDLLAIPVPGHTRGSMGLLWQDVLFSGDHLAWSDTRRALTAFPDACWYDWEEQIASTRRLAEHDFRWVLPGHGRRVHLEPHEVRPAMKRLIRWMIERG